MPRPPGPSFRAGEGSAFLTYGADGVSSGDGTEHHVSEYAVLALDDLVVRLVGDELRPLS
ncbi:hypothetical protein GCM10022252_36330 [Streptosporangium oxazolinicum]|uniref:Uncharacterized protein n=1 Tax=Streptosporangium oxazolinicum TaxID=909287 RepID=A0ABP8AYE8_9ACTN